MTLCILHLGSEKTGTSSIQKYFGLNREKLLGAGCLYPKSFTNPPGHVHIKLSSAALDGSLRTDGADAQSFRAELEAARSRGARQTVISSEFFHSELRDAGSVERLKIFLSAFFDRFKLVYYARRQDQMLASMHSTAIQGGWTSQRSALSVYESKGHYYFDHAAVCDLWSGVFGRENLTCRIFERDKLDNGDIVDDFLAVAGLDPDPDSGKFSANESLSFETMHVLLRLNASRHKDNKELRRKLIATGRQRDGERIPLLTRSEAKGFLSRFDEANTRLFSEYVNPALATAFATDFAGFPESVPDPPPPRQLLDFVFSRKR